MAKATTSKIRRISNLFKSASGDIYLDSSDIKIYPSSRRSDYYDRNSRLSSEQNLVSVVNRLTRKDGFVIKGFTVSEDGKKINPGSCNIHGYLFTISSEIDISSLEPSEDSYVYFSIKVDDIKISIGNRTMNYPELVAFDANHAEYSDVNINDAEKNLLDNTTDTQFRGFVVTKGLKTLKTAETSSDGMVTYRLPIAECVSGIWKTIISNDNTSSKNRWNTQIIDAKDVMVEASTLDKKVVNSNYSEKQDILSWLENNFILDDGEIK